MPAKQVVVLDRLSTGFDWAVAPEATLVEGDIADKDLVGQIIRDHGIDAIIHFAGSIVVPESVADPLGYYENNTCKTRSLIETAVRGGRRAFHLLVDRRRLWRRRHRAGARGRPPCAGIALRPVQADERMDAARRRGRARPRAIRRCAISTSPAPIRSGRTGQSTPGATHLIKVACETALGKRPFMQVFGTDYATPDGTCVRDYIHVSDLAAAHRLALAPPARRRRQPRRQLRLRPRLFGARGHRQRAPGPSAPTSRSAWASAGRRRRRRRRQFRPARAANSAGRPQHDDLDGIVRDALAWERMLTRQELDRAR